MKKDIKEKAKSGYAGITGNIDFKRIIDGMNEGVVLFDGDERIGYINKKFCQIIGYSEDEIIGKKIFMFFDKENRLIVDKQLEKRKKGVIEPYEVNLKTRKDSILVRITPSINYSKGPDDKSRKYVGSTSVITDITDRVRAEKALQRVHLALGEKIKERTAELSKANSTLKNEVSERKKAEKKIRELNNRLEQYAHRLDLKIRRIDERRVPLTPKEKLAFYGLVRYPGYTSKMIGEKIGLQTATVNSIKNRLKKEGYFQKMYVPRLDLMGCSLLSINYLEIDRFRVENDEKARNVIKETERMLDDIPEKVFIIFTKGNAISMTVTKDWNEYKSLQDRFESISRSYPAAIKSDNAVHFPLEKTTFFDYFNFADLIDKRFNLKQKPSRISEPDYKEHKLSMTEKKMAYALMRFPEMTVADLSEKIGISVPTICKIRRKLLKHGILKPINIPDFTKTGMELLILKHNRFPPGESVILKEDMKCTNPSIFLNVASNTDCISMSLHSNYTEAEVEESTCVICASRESVGRKKRMVAPLADIIVFRIDFCSLVKKIFNLDVDY